MRSDHRAHRAAVQSMGNSRLMPLAPYILKAAPVASELYLRQIRDAILNKVQALQQDAVFRQRLPGRADSLEADKLHTLVRADLALLKRVQVDGSVLKTSKIVSVLQDIAAGRKDKSDNKVVFREDCVAAAADIVAAWKLQGIDCCVLPFQCSPTNRNSSTSRPLERSQERQ